MVTVNELQVPNIIPVIVCKELLDKFYVCSICDEQLIEQTQALVLTDKNRVLIAFHVDSAKRDCEMRFKGRFIQLHPKTTQRDMCRILNISRRQFFKLKGQAW